MWVLRKVILDFPHIYQQSFFEDLYGLNLIIHIIHITTTITTIIKVTTAFINVNPQSNHSI